MDWAMITTIIVSVLGGGATAKLIDSYFGNRRDNFQVVIDAQWEDIKGLKVDLKELRRIKDREITDLKSANQAWKLESEKQAKEIADLQREMTRLQRELIALKGGH